MKLLDLNFILGSTLWYHFFGDFLEVKKIEKKGLGGATIRFELRTTHREGPVGKGRVGVNPYPGTGWIGVKSSGSTRSEAKGLGD